MTPKALAIAQRGEMPLDAHAPDCALHTGLVPCTCGASRIGAESAPAVEPTPGEDLAPPVEEPGPVPEGGEASRTREQLIAEIVHLEEKLNEEREYNAKVALEKREVEIERDRLVEDNMRLSETVQQLEVRLSALEETMED